MLHADLSSHDCQKLVAVQGSAWSDEPLKATTTPHQVDAVVVEVGIPSHCVYKDCLTRCFARYYLPLNNGNTHCSMGDEIVQPNWNACTIKLSVHNGDTTHSLYSTRHSA